MSSNFTEIEKKFLTAKIYLLEMTDKIEPRDFSLRFILGRNLKDLQRVSETVKWDKLVPLVY
jgi:hypothetical protein